MSAELIPSVPSQVKRFEWSINRNEFSEEMYPFDSIRSPSFSVGLDNSKSSWRLSLQRLDDGDDCPYSLNFVPASKNPSSVNIKITVGLIMKDETEDNVRSCQIFSGTDVWGCPAFLDEDDLNMDCFFRKSKLTVFCDLQTGLGAPEFSFCQNLADFTLDVGEEELKVHRLVLGLRSPVFKAMFQQETKEKQSGRLEIEDLDVVGVKGLVEFIYSGNVKNLEEVAVNVLPAAEKYGVHELKTLCEKAICNKLTVKNAAILQLFSTDLSAEALDFINTSSAEVAEELKKKFNEMSETNPKVFKEIVKSYAAKRVNESDDIKPKEKRIKLN